MVSPDTAKAQVFGDIRAALSEFSEAQRVEIDLKYRQVSASETPRPAVDGVLIDRFIEKHTAVHGTVSLVSSYSELPATVDEFLHAHNLPPEMVMGNTKFLRTIDWPDEWSIARRPADKSDRVSVTDALCAIAETGTIVVASSSEVSSTHMFLPENHIVVMNIGQLVRHLEDALQLVANAEREHPRAIHMITGPSKTADVEQTIQYGAHGPRRLHAIFVDSSN